MKCDFGVNIKPNPIFIKYIVQQMLKGFLMMFRKSWLRKTKLRPLEAYIQNCYAMIRGHEFICHLRAHQATTHCVSASCPLLFVVCVSLLTGLVGLVWQLPGGTFYHLSGDGKLELLKIDIRVTQRTFLRPEAFENGDSWRGNKTCWLYQWHRVVNHARSYIETKLWKGPTDEWRIMA